MLQTELPKLLQKFTTGTDITEVEGLTRENLNLIGFSDLNDLRNTLLTRAAHVVTLSKPTTSSFAAFVTMTNETYESLFRAAVDSGSPADISTMAEASQRFPISRAALKSLPAIDTAFFLLSALSTSAQTAHTSVNFFLTATGFRATKTLNNGLTQQTDYLANGTTTTIYSQTASGAFVQRDWTTLDGQSYSINLAK